MTASHLRTMPQHWSTHALGHRTHQQGWSCLCLHQQGSSAHNYKTLRQFNTDRCLLVCSLLCPTVRRPLSCQQKRLHLLVEMPFCRTQSAVLSNRICPFVETLKNKVFQGIFKRQHLCLWTTRSTARLVVVGLKKMKPNDRRQLSFTRSTMAVHLRRSVAIQAIPSEFMSANLGNRPQASNVHRGKNRSQSASRQRNSFYRVGWMPRFVQVCWPR